MLVKMASFTLKVEEREKLYYSKYSYKAVCRVRGAYYTNNVTTIDQYIEKIEAIRGGSSRWPMFIDGKLEPIDYHDLDTLIRYIVRFEKNNKGTIRREGNSISFFSNDLSFLKKAPSILSPLKIFQAELLPAGVKYFKRDVPAPYRVHFKETKVNSDIKQDIVSYIERTDGVEASSALMTWLNRPNKWSHSWCSKNYYINYNDSSQLTMMHILFPEVIGKNYKLEQK